MIDFSVAHHQVVEVRDFSESEKLQDLVLSDFSEFSEFGDFALSDFDSATLAAVSQPVVLAPRLVEVFGGSYGLDCDVSKELLRFPASASDDFVFFAVNAFLDRNVCPSVPPPVERHGSTVDFFAPGSQSSDCQFRSGGAAQSWLLKRSAPYSVSASCLPTGGAPNSYTAGFTSSSLTADVAWSEVTRFGVCFDLGSVNFSGRDVKAAGLYYSTFFTQNQVNGWNRPVVLVPFSPSSPSSLVASDFYSFGSAVWGVGEPWPKTSNVYRSYSLPLLESSFSGLSSSGYQCFGLVSEFDALGVEPPRWSSSQTSGGRIYEFPPSSVVTDYPIYWVYSEPLTEESSMVEVELSLSWFDWSVVIVFGVLVSLILAFSVRGSNKRN